MTESNVGIEIRNLPSHLTREELFNVFAKGLDSDNEIKYILYPLPGNAGKAFVCFKQSPDTRFMEGLLTQNPLWSIKSVTRMQTYSTCSAEVNSLVVASIPDVWDCIRMLQTTYGIVADYSEETGKLVLKGSLNQLSCGQERLNCIFEEQMVLQKMGLMHFGRSDQGQITESNRPEDDDVAHGSLSAELRSLKSRALGEVVVEEEEFSGHAVMPRSEGKKWRSYSDVWAFQSTKSSDCERDLTMLKSTNVNNNSQSYFAHKSELSRFESAGTDRSGPQSMPCLTEIDERNISSNAREEFSDLEHKRNYLHSDLASHRRRGKDDEREEADGEIDDVLEGPQDLKSSSYVSSALSAYRGTSENTTSRLSSGGHRRDRILIGPKSAVSAADDSVVDAHSPWKIDFRDDTDDGTISTSIKDRKEFNDRSVSDLPYSAAHYNTDSFLSTEPPHMRMSQLNELELERKSFVFPSEIANEHFMEKNIQEDSLKQESLFLESFVVRYIVAVEKRRVNAIARSCNVRIKVNIEAGSAITEVTLVGNNLCRDEHLKKALTKFTGLYEETFGDIIQREVKCDFTRPEVIAEMRRIRLLDGDRVILITDQTGLIVVVGEFKEVMQAVDTLNKAESGTDNRGHLFATFSGKSSAGKKALLSDPEIENPDENETDEEELCEKEASIMELNDRSIATSSSHSDVTNRDYAAAAKAKQTQPDFAAVPNTNYFHVIFKENFHVFNYTEDITKVKAHAIVNAANSRLKNYGGVAGTIEKVGGRQFEKDCDALYRSHGPLKVSEVLHSAGHGALECAFVMHTVGPQWYSDHDDDTCAADLQATFANVLDYADTVLQSVSIAVPPVGTGVFGVPMDVCARAIYFAVKEFAEKRHRPDSPLRYLHVVSNDPGSTEFIQAVFEGLQLAQEEDQRTRAEAAHSSVDEVVSHGSNNDQAAAGSSSAQNSQLDSISNEDM